MKLKSLVTITLILLALYSCKNDYVKLDESETNKQNLKIATEFANSYIANLNKGEYIHLHYNTTEELKLLLNKEIQEKEFLLLKEQYGDFQDLEYCEAWIDTDKNEIFRFKAKFSECNKKLEIRVVINSSQEISGFWIKKWSDIFNLY